MPVYFFHLRDGQDTLLDPEGMELPSLQAIQRSALSEARSIIAADAKQGVINLSYRLDIEDSAGTLVHSLQFEDAVKIKRGASAA